MRLRLADRPGVVFVPYGGSSLILEEPEDIEHYKIVAVELFKVALTHEESVELVANVAAALV